MLLISINSINSAILKINKWTKKLYVFNSNFQILDPNPMKSINHSILTSLQLNSSNVKILDEINFKFVYI